MVPSTWLSVVFFLLLIAPGLLFDMLAERRRAGADESTFREASRVALSSTAFSGAAFVVLALVRATEPQWMPDPGQLLGNHEAYLRKEYPLVLRALLIQVAIALALAFLTHLMLARSGGARIRQRSAWTTVFGRESPKETETHVRVRLADGTVYVGRLAYFTANLEHADRELVLAPPLFSRTGERQLAPLPKEWQRVILSADQIVAIGVQYQGSGPDPAATTRDAGDEPTLSE